MLRRCIALSVAAWVGMSAQAASIGIYFDTSGRLDRAEVAPFATFVCYVALGDLSGELAGYEFRVLTPPQVTLLSATAIPGSSLNIGSAPANWIVGVGVCLDPQEPRAVVQLTGMLMAEATNLELRLAASQPSSIGGAGPAYAICDGSEIYEFDQISAAVINLRPESFGRVKQRYGSE